MKLKTNKKEASEKSQTFAKETTKQGYSIETEEKQIENNEIIEVIEIKNTPFTAIKEENKWFITMGKYRLTNQLKSLEECKKAIKKDPWTIIMQVCLIMIKEDKKNSLT